MISHCPQNNIPWKIFLPTLLVILLKNTILMPQLSIKSIFLAMQKIWIMSGGHLKQHLTISFVGYKSISQSPSREFVKLKEFLVVVESGPHLGRNSMRPSKFGARSSLFWCFLAVLKNVCCNFPCFSNNLRSSHGFETIFQQDQTWQKIGFNLFLLVQRLCTTYYCRKMQGRPIDCQLNSEIAVL